MSVYWERFDGGYCCGEDIYTLDDMIDIISKIKNFKY